MTTDNNEIANKIFERLDAIGSQVMTTAPMVWEKMVLLIQVESIAYLGVGFGCLVLALGSLFMVFKTAKDFNNRPNLSHYDTPAATILFVALTTVFGFPALVNLLYIWNWIGAFSPESRLIARLIGALTGTTNG